MELVSLFGKNWHSYYFCCHSLHSGDTKMEDCASHQNSTGVCEWYFLLCMIADICYIWRSQHIILLPFLVKELLRRNVRCNQIFTFLSVKAKLEYLAPTLGNNELQKFWFAIPPPVSHWIEPIHLKLQLSPWWTKLAPINLQYSGGKLCPYGIYSVGKGGWELHKLRLPKPLSRE